MKYDKSYFEIYEKSPEKLLKLISQLIKREFDHGGKTILSIGCGPGYNEAFLIKDFSGNFQNGIIGIDINSEILANETKKIIPVINGSSEKLPIKNNSIDCIFSFDNFEHLIFPINFLEEIKRVLKDDGIFLLKLPNFGHLYFRLKILIKGSLGTELQMKKGHVGFWTYNEVVEYLKKNGFKIKKKEIFTYFDFFLKPFAKLFPNIFSVSTIIIAKL